MLVTAELGTLGWAERTSGLLSPSARVRLAGQGLRGQLASALARRGPEIELPTLVPTAATEAALELCREACSPSLVSHSLRTFAWGAALAQQEAISTDLEALYVAALLHDVGLCEPGTDGPHCFTLGSVAALRRVASTAGWDATRTEAAANAITMHMNLYVSRSAPALAYLLAAGAHLDVIAERFRRLPAPFVDEVVRSHPRLGFKQEITERFTRNARANPGTRNAFYLRWLGTRFWIAHAPFAE